MARKTLNQKGFGTLEIILLAVIVIIIVGVGCFVYHSQNSANNTLNSASVATNSSGVPNHYLVVEDLGVKIPANGVLSDLTYQAASNGTSVNLSSKALKLAVGKCQATGTAAPSFPVFATVSKATGTFDSASGTTLAKQFSGSYVSYTLAGDNFCTGTNTALNKAVQTLYNQLTSSLKATIKNTVQS